MYFIWQIRNLGRVWSAETGRNKVRIRWLDIESAFNYHHHQPSKRTISIRARTPPTIFSQFKGLFLEAKLLLYAAKFSRPGSLLVSSFILITAHTYSSYSRSNLFFPSFMIVLIKIPTHPLSKYVHVVRTDDTFPTNRSIKQSRIQQTIPRTHQTQQRIGTGDF